MHACIDCLSLLFRYGCWLYPFPAVRADWGVLLAAGSLPDCHEHGAVPTAAEAPVLGHAHSVHVWCVVLHCRSHLHTYLHHHSSGKPDAPKSPPNPPTLPPSSLPPSSFPMIQPVTVPGMCYNCDAWLQCLHGSALLCSNIIHANIIVV